MTADRLCIDDAFIERLCAVDPARLDTFSASEMAIRMGSLASWWLKPHVLQRAAAAPEVPDKLRRLWLRRPALPVTPGACWPIIANQQRGLTLLRQAFVLPLRWIPGQPDDRHLPSALLRLSGKLRRELRHQHSLPSQATSPTKWGLWLALEPGNIQPDLSGLTRINWNSAWAALAAGLITAAHGARPDSTVWASGGWAQGRIAPVEAVADKLALAREWGARYFFLPADQVQDNEWPSRLQCGTLQCEATRIHEALQHYLHALQIPPAPEASRQARRHYYLSLPDDAAARTYFCQCCLPEIAEQQQQKIGLQFGLMPSHLLTVASRSPELVALAVATLRPRHCLIVHTIEGDFPSLSQLAIELCQGFGTHFERAAIEDHGPSLVGTRLRCLVHEFAPSDPGRLAIDLTPGRKDLTLALAFEAAPDGCHLLYCTHEVSPPPHRRPVPFTQEFRLYRPPGTGPPKPDNPR